VSSLLVRLKPDATRGRDTTRRIVLGLVAGFWLVATACRGAEPRAVRVEAIDVAGQAAGWLALPSRPDSVKFAVIGDSGRGWKPQHEVADQMLAFRERFPFAAVLMAGDNIYEGPATPDDYRVKFEEPYAELLASDVEFFAVLGNHDDPRQRDYQPFNMGGERYYTFRPPANPLAAAVSGVQVFALDSTSLDRTQLVWLAEQLADSDARWKIVLLHHPLYTSGRYGVHARLMRWRLEHLFIAHGVDVVFSGHEHIYERSHPHGGVVYFISGGAGSLRKEDGGRPGVMAHSFNDDFHFMLVEVTRSALYFQAITRSGVTVDAGVLQKP
jgi:predicted phosphodiesterase